MLHLFSKRVIFLEVSLTLLNQANKNGLYALQILHAQIKIFMI